MYDVSPADYDYDDGKPWTLIRKQSSTRQPGLLCSVGYGIDLTAAVWIGLPFDATIYACHKSGMGLVTSNVLAGAVGLMWFPIGWPNILATVGTGAAIGCVLAYKHRKMDAIEIASRPNRTEKTKRNRQKHAWFSSLSRREGDPTRKRGGVEGAAAFAPTVIELPSSIEEEDTDESRAESFANDKIAPGAGK